ncbi:hypothetical protein DFH05DRAFT_1458992 [Lentinula detonsa]|uniref:Acetoacetate decarboxylase n=1 Tax=Lentinula detonsa TaxID=2804962 RepID=A0A9W8TZJ7_9AGAR|nr:hypothetical protein DFH05DRAFT_1458992 [Lentinula detonsa]
MTVAGQPSRNKTDFNGILLAPAPWQLKARMWHFLVSPLKANTINGKSNAVFPAGWAAPFQAEPLAEGDFVTGHPGVIMLVQYTESPVGPYDELIYIAGKFSMHKEPNSNETNKAETGFRITRIYVSTKESAANGRRNWNIAKELADFKYTRHSDGSWDLAVFPSNPLISETLETPAEVRRPNIPFFHISIHPIPMLGSLCIPINFNILGSYFRLLNPPIPNGPPGSSPALVKSNTNSDGSIKEPKWAALVPGIKGKMRLVTYKPKVDVGSDLEGEDGRKRKAHLAIADGVNFPAVVPWKMGAYLEGVDMHFDAPEWL